MGDLSIGRGWRNKLGGVVRIAVVYTRRAL